MQEANDQLGSSIGSGSDHSKSSMYRAMVARTDSTVWRGNARNKLQAGIEDGASEPIMVASTEGLGEGSLVDEALDDSTLLPSKEPSEEVTEEEEAMNQETAESDAELPDHEDDKADLVETPTEDTLEEEEPQIPIIYKNWEPTSDDEETEMDDVELGGESEMENHIGECKMDSEAFNRLRELERERAEQRRKNRLYATTFGLMVLALLALISWQIATLVSSSKGSESSQMTASADTVNSNLSIDNSQSGVANNEFTGHLTPFQDPEVAYGNKITVKFPVNMLVPEGGSIFHKVYDGPDCSSYSGGAMDITGMGSYVESGVYSAGPAHRTRNPAERLGLFLQWDFDHVQESPLYTYWRASGPTDVANFNPLATMDLCVALAILNAAGLPEHFMETYILTTWADDNRVEEIHLVPVTIDST